MAKQQKTIPASSKKSFIIPERWRDAGACGVLILAIILFFRKALFTSLGFFASDYIASQSFMPLYEAAKHRGDAMLWLPNIFSGMPVFGGNYGTRAYDFLTEIISGFAYNVWPSFFVNSSTSTTVILWYIIIAIGTYLFVRRLVGLRTASLVAAFATVFSTVMIILVMIGHATKPQAYAAYPFIFLALVELLRSESWRKRIVWFSVLALATEHLIGSSHIQFIYYAFLAIGLFFLFELVHAIRSKRWNSFAVTAGAFTLAVGLAFAVHAEQYLATFEYTPYSVRGSGPAEAPPESAQKAADPAGGLDYEYATNWSYSPGELTTLLVPNFFGFGTLPYKGQHISTYFGQMPFSDHADYMGITILILAFVGAIGAWRERFVKFLVVLSVLAVVVAFGKNFPLLYDLFFYHAPAFNKFRAPVMILILMAWALPILAAFGIKELFEALREGKNSPKWISFGKRGAIAAGAALVIFFVMQSPIRSWYEGLIAAGRSVKEYPQNTYGIIFDNFSSDVIAACLFAGATFVIVWLAGARKLSLTVLIVALPVLVGIDLMRVASRPMDLKPDGTKAAFVERDYMKFLRQDTTHFRIIDHAIEAPNMSAYFGFYTAEGYHPAKMRLYQDVLDATTPGSTSQLGSPFMWNLLDVKYYIDKKPILDSAYGIVPVWRGRDGVVMRNEHNLGHAFFVARTEVAKPLDILHHLRDANFNPREVAFIEAPLAQSVDAADQSSIASVTKFENERIAISATASGNNFLVVSEIYYPAGWKAFIDGAETPIIKTDYLLRGIVVPRGLHSIEFRYEPASFAKGKTITLISNAILAALLVVGVMFARKEKKNIPTSAQP